MGLSYISFFEGDARKVFEGAETLLEYGKKNANNRSMVFGHWATSLAHYITGNMEAAIRCGNDALKIALDPLYSQFPKLSLGVQYLLNNQVQEAEEVLQSAIDYSARYNVGQFLDLATLFMAPTKVASGHMNQGLKIMEDTRQSLIKNQRGTWLAQSENILGFIYSQVATGPKPALATIAKNIGFLVKNIPQAAKKAEEHFEKAIKLSEQMGAHYIYGNACLNLGMHYIERKKPDLAQKYLSEATIVFEASRADSFLKQAQDALASLNS
jgi:tetratricopeptide (TPR) repeat protein